jgi:hypothetical protein
MEIQRYSRGYAVNFAQRIILTIGVLVVTTIVLFPPWVYVYHYDPVTHPFRSFSDQRLERPAGYHTIWGSNVPSDTAALGQLFSVTPEKFMEDRLDPKYFSMRIDKDRLWIQLAGAVIVTGLLVLLLRKPVNATST